MKKKFYEKKLDKLNFKISLMEAKLKVLKEERDNTAFIYHHADEENKSEPNLTK